MHIAATRQVSNNLHDIGIVTSQIPTAFNIKFYYELHEFKAALSDNNRVDIQCNDIDKGSIEVLVSLDGYLLAVITYQRESQLQKCLITHRFKVRHVTPASIETVINDSLDIDKLIKQ